MKRVQSGLKGFIEIEMSASKNAADFKKGLDFELRSFRRDAINVYKAYVKACREAGVKEYTGVSKPYGRTL